MPAIPVVLPSFSWPTKSAALAAFRDLHTAGSYAVYDRISDPDHDLMLREVLDLHPDAAEKIGLGVEYFYVGFTKDGDKFNVRPDATGIWIKRTDGSEVDFSYRTCINNHTDESDAKEGLRLAVEDRRLAYRAKRMAAGTFESDVSGAAFASRDDASVFYDDPSWGQLTYRFAESEGGWDKILVHSGRGAVVIGSHLLDPGVEARWLAFWDAHASLQLATRSEVASRPRPPQDGCHNPKYLLLRLTSTVTKASAQSVLSVFRIQETGPRRYGCATCTAACKWGLRGSSAPSGHVRFLEEIVSPPLVSVTAKRLTACTYSLHSSFRSDMTTSRPTRIAPPDFEAAGGLTPSLTPGIVTIAPTSSLTKSDKR